jgi:two-component system cell cycle response regulator PopA
LPTDARILIVSKDEFLTGPLAEGMGKLGWPAVAARGAAAAVASVSDRGVEGVILDLSDGEFAGLAQRLKDASSPRRLPVIAVGEPGGERDTIDLTLSAPLHPAQAVLRMESLVRMAVAEEEFELRRETFAERGRQLELPESSAAPFRVLCIGEPAPQFLALSNALARNGAEVVGAFTAYTAFDYLHEKPFDAVVLWAAGDNEAEAMSIAAGMRRNTRLYHVPTLLYLGAGTRVTMAEAFHRGVSDIASPDTPEDETARRVVELARSYRRQSAIRHALEKARSSGLMDAATGLFTRDLFAVHLTRLAAAATARNRSLSVCVLRVADSPAIAAARKGGWLDRAVPQIGSMIGRLVRAEDTAARLGPEVFALALPSTPLGAARSAADRITAVIGCTAFDAGDGKAPFVADFEIGVAEVGPGETAGRAIERAGSRALQRQAS